MRGRTSKTFRKLRAKLRNEHHPNCYLCGQPIDYEAKHTDPESFSVDHILPLHTHPHLAETYSNLAPTHLRCNKSKGTSKPKPGLGNHKQQW